ncbi:MAG: L-rhamnose 1-dehydrogenase [Candidatus Hydrogenedentes bacterium]|nr:L-rhamnose 1-dehydrogenase [Candidatus Hydrogenedentota bacterium]
MDNQVVIVTGGSRGIGYGIASCFARKGASLVIGDVDLDAARKAAGELNAMSAVDSIGVLCDVTDRVQVAAMMDRTVEVFGRIDVLVNNAGICPFVDFLEMTPEIWQRTLDVNLNGAFHCTQLAARKMIERGKGGRIVFITSLAENVSNENQVDYGASKAGLKMLMVGSSIGLARHGITCNAIAPGMIMTPMVAHHWSKPENAAFAKERIPVGRIGTPEDIGNVAVFLASPEAAYINGVSIRVDGGHQTRAV